MGSHGAPSLISGGWRKSPPPPAFSSESETSPLTGLTLENIFAFGADNMTERSEKATTIALNIHSYI